MKREVQIPVREVKPGDEVYDQVVLDVAELRVADTGPVKTVMLVALASPKIRWPSVIFAEYNPDGTITVKRDVDLDEVFVFDLAPGDELVRAGESPRTVANVASLDRMVVVQFEQRDSSGRRFNCSWSWSNADPAPRVMVVIHP